MVLTISFLLFQGYVLYQTSATPSTNNVVSEDDHLIIYEGPAKVYNFGGQTGPRCWNGQMVYMTVSIVGSSSIVSVFGYIHAALSSLSTRGLVHTSCNKN